MTTHLDSDLIARDAKIALVVSRFNDFLTAKLLDAALHTHKRHGGNPDHLTVAHVPGSLEIPVTALRLAQSGKHQAIVALGCIIRGQTDHYDHVAAETARGIAHVGLSTGVPTIFGVITANTLEQAIERAGSKQGNQGAKAMLAAIEMANLFKSL